MRITSKGQVTIPAKIREQAGLLPNTEVEWQFDGQTVKLRPARKGKRTRGDEIVETLRRSKSKTIGLSTDQIMALMRPR